MPIADDKRKIKKKVGHSERLKSRNASPRQHLQKRTPKTVILEHPGALLSADFKGPSPVVFKSSAIKATSSFLIFSSVGHLWCLACSKSIDYSKEQKVDQHLLGERHKQYVLEHKEKKEKQRSLTELISNSSNPTAAAPSTTVAAEDRAWIVHCIQECLKGSIDISKIADIANLLSENHPRVPSSRSSLQEFLPFIRETERAKLRPLLARLEYFSELIL